MTESSQCRHGIIKVCSIEYLTTEIDLVLPTFKSWTIDKIIDYLMLGLLCSLWNIYHSTTASIFLLHRVCVMEYALIKSCYFECNTNILQLFY